MIISLFISWKRQKKEEEEEEERSEHCLCDNT